MSKAVLGMVAVAGLATAAAANDYNGAGAPIPDFASGTPGVFTNTISVADSFQVAAIEVSLHNLAHTWVGDLHVTLSHGGTSVDLVNRIGRTGGSGVGDSSNYNGTYRFVEPPGGADIWAEAANGTSDYVLASGTYNISGVDNGPSSFASLLGNSAGDWTLTITDNAGGDTGSLGSWTLTLVPVPAPGAAALLGLGGLVIARRRRA